MPNFFWNLFILCVKQIIHFLAQKSIYLNSIWVFLFFNFIFMLKWSKQEIINKRIERRQRFLVQEGIFRSSHHRCSVKKIFLKIPENKVADLRHRCFPVNFSRFLRTAFLQNTSRWLLLNIAELKTWLRNYFLTHFSPVSHFYTPWFLYPSGGIEMWHWTKMG